jgi:hypothetical protein|tara:strand:- start:358 stop:2508 length:2151 start_codon:yes stop_codon:yes gene_type:complete
MKNFAQSISINDQKEIAVSDGSYSYLYKWESSDWVISEYFDGGSSVSCSNDGNTIAICDNKKSLVLILNKTQGSWVEVYSNYFNQSNFNSECKLSGDGKLLCITSRNALHVLKLDQGTWGTLQEFNLKNVDINGLSMKVELQDFDISSDGSKIILSHEWVMPLVQNVDDDEWLALESRFKDNSIEVWSTSSTGNYEKKFTTTGKTCKISGSGNRILIGDPINKSVQVMQDNGDSNFQIIGEKIYSKINNFGSSLSIDHSGSRISVYEEFSQGRVKVYSYENKQWSSIGNPFSASYQTNSYGAVHQLSPDGTSIVIASQGVNVEVFDLTSKVLYLNKQVDMDFGDIDWREREAYELSGFISNSDFDLNFNLINDILPTELPTENHQSTNLSYSWIIDDRYSEYSEKNNYENIIEDKISPYGSIIGNYEFINISNISKWQNNEITRHTKNSQYFYSDCPAKRDRYSEGKCRPTWVEKDGFRNEDPSVMYLDYLYAKDFINEKNLSSTSDQYSEIQLDPATYRPVGSVGSDDYFKDNQANRFWSNLCIKMKGVNVGKSIIETDNFNQKYLTIKSPDMSTDLWRFTPDLTNFLGERLNLTDLPYELDSNILLNLGKTSSCGGSISYLGSNEDGHIIERQLVCMPATRLVENKSQKYLIIFIQWSIHYVHPPVDKVMPAVVRRLYNINDKFSYRGSRYGVYDNFPFEDFSMTPIRWNKSVK